MIYNESYLKDREVLEIYFFIFNDKNLLEFYYGSF